MLCDKIRGSHIDWYLRCPLYYKYAVHDRRMPDIVVPRWAVLGWVIHKTLEVAVQEKRYASDVFEKMILREEEIVREEVASSWPDYPLQKHEIPGIDVTNYMRAMKMLANWDSQAEMIWSADKIVVEEGFSVTLDRSVGAVMTGRIDLKLWFGDVLEIWDYKSTQPLFEYKDVPPQLLRYAIGVCLQADAPIKSVRSVLFNLQTGNILKKSWTSDEANRMIDYIVDVVAEIKATDPEKAKGCAGSHCKTLCQYHPSCPVYKVYQASQASRKRK